MGRLHKFFDYNRSTKKHNDIYVDIQQDLSIQLDITAKLNNSNQNLHMVTASSQFTNSREHIWLTEEECNKTNFKHPTDKRLSDALKSFLNDQDSPNDFVLDNSIFYIYNDVVKGYLDNNLSLWKSSIKSHPRPKNIQWKVSCRNQTGLKIRSMADYSYNFDYGLDQRVLYLVEKGDFLFLKFRIKNNQSIIDANLHHFGLDIMDQEYVDPNSKWVMKFN